MPQGIKTAIRSLTTAAVALLMPVLTATAATAQTVPPAPLSAPAGKTAPQAVKLFYLSNMPEIFPAQGEPGLARAAAVLADLRRGPVPVHFIHGGDSLAPSALAAFDYGAHMIDLLNAMEPTAMAIGKREYSFGLDELILRSAEANFPMIASNVTDTRFGRQPEGLKESLLLDLGGFTLGLIGTVNPSLTYKYNVPTVRVESVTEAIRRRAADLRRRGATIVVALTESRIETDRDDHPDEALVRDGSVDMLIEAVSDENSITPLGEGLLVRNGGDTGPVAVLTLQPRRRADRTLRGCLCSGELVPLDTVKPDPEIQRLITSYTGRLSSLLDTPVGVSSTPLETGRDIVRSRETAFGNLVADGMRHVLGAEVAIANGGSIRGNRQYPAGVTLTRRHIQAELPFREHVGLYAVTGAQILGALENGLSQLEDRSGRFLHVSNMVVRFNSAAPAGQRVVSVEVMGKPLDPQRSYKVAITRFVAEGGDQFSMLAGAPRLSHDVNRRLQWEVLSEYISSRGTVAPAVEGRLIDLAPAPAKATTTKD
ncbi:bifunctional metallophosphatase/5'-nucleotidase [Novispirillum itersonii]|uniref:2',3'-cyclic-nucleotide 2'-phosphodiesterase (5'-nucleotidase family) n=1 Tax=Novispirillum itersonii TaxID=189 RepID=A0A7X0DKU0_NOVIT|nr:5'-nucleotidase C-terminal domain-containing protein [Novispirillum itersonii]MBB6209313.1 2',3'-cyclic-nucleotide 2'-phosphodiesterase (5'-nucleotidase family) [Novispirillum itersonii]